MDTAVDRVHNAANGVLKIREDKPIIEPNVHSAVARLPEEFRIAREGK